MDGLYLSPALTALGLVAGSTSASLGSMGGSVFPLDAQARNRQTLARRLGFDDTVRVRQVHGATVLRAEAPFPEPWPQADGLVTDRPGVLLAMTAADCAALLLADVAAGLIGIAHAGWEGTSSRIAQVLVRELVNAGAEPARIVASIGPTIGACCYGIDAQRAATIRERLGADAADALRTDGDGIVFDVAGANATQLRDAGVGTVEVAGMCTRSGGHDLWSYRARVDRGPQGSGLAVLGMRA